MSSLRQRYKDFVIEARAKLVGAGGFTVPSGERRYLPMAVVHRATRSGEDAFGEHTVSSGIVIQVTMHDQLSADPYRAIRCAIDFAQRVIDGIVPADADLCASATTRIPIAWSLH